MISPSKAIDFMTAMARLRPAFVVRQTQARLHNRPILDRLALQQKVCPA